MVLYSCDFIKQQLCLQELTSLHLHSEDLIKSCFKRGGY